MQIFIDNPDASRFKGKYEGIREEVVKLYGQCSKHVWVLPRSGEFQFFASEIENFFYQSPEADLRNIYKLNLGDNICGGRPQFESSAISTPRSTVDNFHRLHLFR